MSRRAGDCCTTPGCPSSPPTPSPRPRTRWSPPPARPSQPDPLSEEHMAILIDERTRVIVQGITGNIGRFHTDEMIRYGTTLIGGVTPGRGGSIVLGRPVFNTVKDAVAATKATASIVFVPPPFAADAIMEAADAGIRYCVCITDGIPTQDMMRVKRY